MKLFCIPFAGGSSYSYKGLSDELHSSVEAVMLELPGRGRRFPEPLLTDAHAIADDLYKQVTAQLHEPYAFYGHSLGSLLAFLLTRRIMNDGHRKPLYLFLSGCEAPSVLPREIRHLLPKREFKEVVRSFGGCPPDVLNNEELMEIFEPILRADFKAYETYIHEAGTKLDVPIVAMIGDEEDLAMEEVKKWQAETSSRMSLYLFPGDHFFIYRHWDRIGRLISACLGTCGT
jgi:surfactin synthase thioesterase subunit